MRKYVFAALALSCLACGGVAAAESGSKVGYDPTTRKFRPLTAAESAELDRQAAAKKAAPLAARGKTTSQAAAEPAPAFRVSRSGRVVATLPESEMSTLTVTRAADGSLVVSHDGEPVPGATAEVGNE